MDENTTSHARAKCKPAQPRKHEIIRATESCRFYLLQPRLVECVVAFVFSRRSTNKLFTQSEKTEKHTPFISPDMTARDAGRCSWLLLLMFAGGACCACRWGILRADSGKLPRFGACTRCNRCKQGYLVTVCPGLRFSTVKPCASIYFAKRSGTRPHPRKMVNPAFYCRYDTRVD